MRIDPAGREGPTEGKARGPRWRRTSRGFYVPANVDLTPEQRILEASMVLPEHGGVTGWGALHWQGGTWFDGLGASGRARSVCLATAGDDIRAQPGIAISAERLNPVDLIKVDGVRITIPTRSVCFEMRYAESLWRAVQFLDMAAYSDLVSIAEETAYVRRHSGWTGIPQARAVLALADENSWSPQETLMRLVWVLSAGLPRPLCNRPLFDRAGRHVGTPDLLDVEAGLVGEFEGPVHLDRARRRSDLQREERFRRLGLEVVTMTALDHGDRAAFAEHINAVRGRALFAAESTRPWTVVPPAWWTPTHTVERRRALGGSRRARLLAYRSAA